MLLGAVKMTQSWSAAVSASVELLNGGVKSRCAGVGSLLYASPRFSRTSRGLDLADKAAGDLVIVGP